jgi:hypothetical protein
MSTKSKPRVISKSAWLAANDSGPHYAVLGSGLREDGNHLYVKFMIPDSGALVRSGRLREDLREAAIIFTSHPEGTDELMRELVITAAIRGPGQDTLARMIQAGNDLTPYLISEMLLEPKITPEEVAEGLLPPLDVKMLLEFADRVRSVDAAGNALPITTLEKWASFRHQPDRRAGTGDGAANGDEPGGAVPEPDKEAV